MKIILSYIVRNVFIKNNVMKMDKIYLTMKGIEHYLS